MKFLILLILIFTYNCTGNKVSNYHGSKSLENKFDKIEVGITNKNDLINIIGPPSSISDFDKNKWFYIERLKTNQSLVKLGTQRIKKNNILVVQLSSSGILKNKKLLNLEDMNDLKYLKKTTTKDFKNDDIFYGIFSSLREKINAPLRNR